jgi:hypothetical protein
MKTLNSYAVKDLKKAISKYNIRGYSKMNKPQLIKFMLSREHYDKFKYLHDEPKPKAKIIKRKPKTPSITITEEPKKIKKKEKKSEPVPKLEKKKFKIKLPKDRPKIKLTEFPDTEEEKPKGKGPLKFYTKKETEELNKRKLDENGKDLQKQIYQDISTYYGELIKFRKQYLNNEISIQEFNSKEEKETEELEEFIFDELQKEEYSRDLVQSFYTIPTHSNFSMSMFFTKLNPKYIDIKSLRLYKEYQEILKKKPKGKTQKKNKFPVVSEEELKKIDKQISAIKTKRRVLQKKIGFGSKLSKSEKEEVEKKIKPLNIEIDKLAKKGAYGIFYTENKEQIKNILKDKLTSKRYEEIRNFINKAIALKDIGSSKAFQNQYRLYNSFDEDKEVMLYNETGFQINIKKKK